MKKAYECPEIEVIRFETEDVITTSDWKPGPEIGDEGTPIVPIG